MKSLSFLFVLFSAFSAFADDGNPVRRVPPPLPLPAVKPVPFHTPDVREVKTKSGLTAWLIEEKSAPVIALTALFKGGAAADPARLRGLTPLTVALLGEGAGRIKAAEFKQILAEKAISLDFSSGADYIAADMATLRPHREEAFRLLKLALTAPRFDMPALRRVKRQMETDIDARKGDPNAVAYERFLKLMFRDHPYARITPSKKGLRAVTRTNMRSLVRGRFARDNLILAVVGNISADELKPLLESTFDDLPERADLPEIEPFEPQLKAGTDVLTLDAPQSAAVFGHKGIPRGDPDFYAALLVNYAFGGGGFASRLFNEVREKNGFAYSIRTSFVPFRFSPMFIGTAASDNAKISRALDIVKTEWLKMAQNGPTAKEIKDAKTYLTGSFPLSFSSSSRLASFLAGIRYNGEGIDYLKNRNALMNAVDPDTARRVAARLLDPASLFFVVVGKPANL